MSTALDPEELLYAYQAGMFPMADPDGTIRWYRADPRAIMPLDERFHIGRSTRRFLRSCQWQLTSNQCFEEVMRGCAEREDTWISDAFIESYGVLHQHQYASSVEVWHENKLIGGLYGVCIGKAFFGESMFSRRSNASRVALCATVWILRQSGFTLFDAQIANDHTRQFGLLDVDEVDYMQWLQQSLEGPPAQWDDSLLANLTPIKLAEGLEQLC